MSKSLLVVFLFCQAIVANELTLEQESYLIGIESLVDNAELLIEEAQKNEQHFSAYTSNVPQLLDSAVAQKKQYLRNVSHPKVKKLQKRINGLYTKLRTLREKYQQQKPPNASSALYQQLQSYLHDPIVVKKLAFYQKWANGRIPLWDKEYFEKQLSQSQQLQQHFLTTEKNHRAIADVNKHIATIKNSLKTHYHNAKPPFSSDHPQWKQAQLFLAQGKFSSALSIFQQLLENPESTQVKIQHLGKWYPGTILKSHNQRYLVRYQQYEWVEEKRLQTSYEVGTTVKIDGYPGKIIAIRDTTTKKYRVHYTEYSSDYDEWVEENRLQVDENAVMAKKANSTQDYQVGSTVEIDYNGSWYPGKILQVKDAQYKVTYDGYADSYDEWVSRKRLRLLSQVSKPVSHYVIGKQVKVRYEGNWHPGKIIEIRSGHDAKYKIHYSERDGLNDKWVKERQLKREKHSINTTNFSALLQMKIGDCHQELGEHQQAIGSYNKALRIYSEQQLQEDTILAQVKIGHVDLSLGQYNNAISHYQKALQLHQSVQSHHGATIFNALGDAQYHMGNYNKAKKHYEAALQKALLFDQESEAMLSHSNIAKVYRSWGDFSPTLQHFLEGEFVFTATHAKDNQMALLSQLKGKYSDLVKYREKILLAKSHPQPQDFNDLGMSYYHWQNYGQALKYFKKGLNLAEQEQQQPREIRSLNNTALVYIQWKLYKKAQQYLEKALQMAENTQRAEDKAYTQRNLALLYLKRGQRDQAQTYASNALQMAKKIQNPLQIAAGYQSLGDVEVISENYQRGLQHYQQALDIYTTSKLQKHMVEVLLKVGDLYKLWGKYAKAKQYFLRAKKIVYRIGIAHTLSYSKEGNMYYAQGKYHEAIHLYKEALNHEKEHGRFAHIAYNHRNIGKVYHAWGQYAQAITHFTQALVVDKKLRHKADIAQDLDNIGLVYLSWGLYNKAHEHFTKALRNAQDLQHSYLVAIISGHLGQMHYAQAHYQFAIEKYQQQLAIITTLELQEEMAQCCNHLGSIYYKWRHSAPALQQFQQALQISLNLGRKADQGIALLNIGKVHRLSQPKVAINYFKKALAILNKINRKADSATVLMEMGLTYKNSKKYTAAATYFHKSISILEEIRREAQDDIRRDYLHSQIRAYEELISTYVRQQNFVKAFAAIEFSRSKWLAAKLNNNAALETVSLHHVQQKLNHDSAIVVYANTNREKMVQMVITKNSTFASEVSSAHFVTRGWHLFRDEINELFDNNKMIESYIKDDKRKNKFDTLIKYYRNLLTNPALTQAQEETSFTKMNDLLYQLLISPLYSQIKNYKVLTIVPDGMLSFIPFESLFHKRRYLIEDFHIRYANSMSVLHLVEKRKAERHKEYQSFLGLGGAVYEQQTFASDIIDNERKLTYLQQEVQKSFSTRGSNRKAYQALGVDSWMNLPGTLVEVKSIAQIIPQSKIVTGEKVSESYIKQLSQSGELANYRLIHFATHGISLPEIPELSAIVLSQLNTQQNEDGYLSMREVAQLNMASEFVNLSACETGLGKLYSGEGVVGLTQSFLIAGNDSISVSLWQVDDTSTSQFMLSLYRFIQQDKLPYDLAMTKVKRMFLRQGKYRAPFYWSPFVYYGAIRNDF